MIIKNIKPIKKVLNFRLTYAFVGVFLALAFLEAQAGIVSSPKTDGEKLTVGVWSDLVRDLNSFEQRITAAENAGFGGELTTTSYSWNLNGGYGQINGGTPIDAGPDCKANLVVSSQLIYCEYSWDLGIHSFCSLTGYSGPGGKDTHCLLSESGGGWTLDIQDHSDSSNSQACTALCFD